MIYIYIYMYVKGVQCYELFGGIALKNHTFSFFSYSSKPLSLMQSLYLSSNLPTSGKYKSRKILTHDFALFAPHYIINEFWDNFKIYICRVLLFASQGQTKNYG